MKKLKFLRDVLSISSLKHYLLHDFYKKLLTVIIDDKLNASLNNRRKLYRSSSFQAAARIVPGLTTRKSRGIFVDNLILRGIVVM